MVENVATIDYFVCPRGDPHVWDYRGRRLQTYRCRRCQLSVTKAALKEATDA